jgi:diguanylate cyclase (GGDEF)-like protein
MPNYSKNLAIEESQSLRLFIISISLVATLCIISGFMGMAFYSRDLIREEMLNSARRNFTNIVLMRRWNANHGGVYVLKGPGVESNPYLENPDITAVDGKVYTLKNPALMTREISELLKKEQGFFFHITSLKPLNPNNQPDDKERTALTAFETGVPEFAWEQDIDGMAHYRYMAPLKVEERCLTCHAKQGYREGDIRGGISISFQMSEVQKRLQHNSLVILGLATLTICVVMLFIGLFFRGLIRKLADARATLNQMAMTDQLTGLANRHALFERLDEEYERQKRSGQPLSVAMIDVDHFKLVNDSYGHATGDTVLQQIAFHIRSGVRKYDVATRFGGEEFLVLLPNCDLINTQQTAERIRKAIEEQVHAGSGDGQRGITVSMGVASLRPGEDKEALIHRADTALYRAKADGRNRVVSEPM